jgi:hypothetical protein
VPDPQHEPRLPKWASPVVLLFLTTLGLMAVLQLLAHLGAKDFLDETAKQTDAALHALNPLALGRRFAAIFGGLLNPCSLVTGYTAIRQCYQEHSSSNPNFPQVGIDLLHALYLLVREIFAESWVSAIVDTLQLVVGFSAATYLAARFNVLRAELSYFLMLAFIPFGIVCTCLLSLPLLWLVHAASWMLGDVLPAPLHFGLLGGGWTAFMSVCYSRTFEAVLHHKFGRFLERVIARR